jgi:hypothetical protein
MSWSPTRPADAPRRLPLALASALVAIALMGAVVGSFAERFAAGSTFFYLFKFRQAQEGPPVDIVIVGASQTVASVRPDILKTALPPDTRVYNYGVPAMSPSGGEALLRHYLAAHEPPPLVVISFTSLIYADRRGEFERYTLTHTLGPQAVVQAIVADRRPYYGLAWTASRLSLVRYRESIRIAAGSAVLGALPAVRPVFREWLGWGDGPNADYRFEFTYGDIPARNAALAAELERSGGYHFWKEYVTDRRFGASKPDAPGRRATGALGWREAADAAPPMPFVASPRARAAMERIIALCAEHDVPILLLAAPHSAFLAASLRRDGGAERMQAFWDALRRHPNVTAMPEPAVVYPNKLFADPTHSRPAGAERYSTEIAPIVARSYREAVRRSTASVM